MAMDDRGGEAPRRLTLNDELCIGVAAETKPKLLAALDGAACLEVDLSGITEIDSAGFQLLALLKREAAAAGKTVAFVRHSGPVLRLFDLYNAAPGFGDPIVIPSGQAR